jgi:hypothetical protein
MPNTKSAACGSGTAVRISTGWADTVGKFRELLTELTVASDP